MSLQANQYMREWYKKNSARVKARTLKYQQTHPEKRRQWAQKYLYGITKEQYDNFLLKQNNRCAICKTSNPKGSGSWHVDHDHQTLKVRGLLCNNCNLGLGYFADSKAGLLAAIEYLSAF